MSPDPEIALKLFKEMFKIRQFEKKVEFLFTRGRIHGTSHLYIGQEAIAVGVCSQLKENDFVTSTHRGHGHAIAKQLPLSLLLAELQGKETGFCSGRGGTQHIVSMKHHFIANGVTGGAAVTGTGIALSFQMQQKKQIVVSFFGDGAINEGHIHEAINIAAVWKLPIIYVCENNLYAMSTHTKETMVIQDISERAKSYGIKTYCIDGNDLDLVIETIKEAAERSRQELGPVFVECKTYRHSGHSKNDQFLYRTREEESIWTTKDPIYRYEKKLEQYYNISKEKIDDIKKQVSEEIEEASSFAHASSFPHVNTVYNNLWG